MNNNQNIRRNPFSGDVSQTSHKVHYTNKERSRQDGNRFSKRSNQDTYNNNRGNRYYNKNNKSRYNNNNNTYYNNRLHNVNVFNKEERGFQVKGEDFPSLSGVDYKKTEQKSVMNYSQKLQTVNIENKKTIPAPKKKFVSLVNLSKKKKNYNEEEFETDEEMQEHMENQYNSMDEELEEMYENEQYDTNEQFRKENEDYDY